MPNKHPEIFISYSWHDEGLNVADDLERCLQKKGFAVMRDNRAISYKGLIKEYMQRLGRGRCVILVLSDRYFKSPNCMYELLEIAQQPDFQKRIFPVVADNTLFYRSEDRLKYLIYWDEEKTRLQEEIRQIPNLANLHGITDDLDLYDDIRRNIARLLDFLRNLNTYPLHGGNYAPLLEAIQANLPTAELDYSRLPIDFSSTIEFLTQYFVGRQDAMARIDEFIQTHRSGYLAIVGETGIGKSALLAYEVKKRNAVHHFVDDKQNSAKDEVFLRSIVGQLQQQYGFEFEERTPISVSEWNIYFQKWIKEISAEEQLVIFVDALDEAQHYGGSDNLLKYLPQTLPENVYLILSSRPELRKRNVTSSDSTVFEQYELLPLNQADIEAYLAEFALPQTVEEIATAVYQKTKGNALYLYHLIKECQEKQLTIEQIAKLPEKLEEFYQDQWEKLSSGSDETTQAGREQILCLLLLLKEPSSEDMLSRLTGFYRAKLQRYLTPLRRFMHTGEQYALFHESFKNFIVHQLEQEIPVYHEQLIRKLWNWQELKGTLSSYALFWLPTHLLEAKQYDELFALARATTFRQAQARAFPDVPTFPLRTLQTALQGAAEADNAARIAEFLLAHARQAEELKQKNPLEALRNGNLKRAWELADLYEIGRCTLWYLLLAWELKDTGRQDEALTTLERLQGKELTRLSLPRLSGEMLSEWQGQYAVYLLFHVVEVVSGEIFTALYLRLLNDEDLRTLCNFLSAQGYFASALGIAQGFQERLRAEALGTIAQFQAQAGERKAAQRIFAIALMTARGIKEERERAETLIVIVQEQVKAMEFTAALKTAFEIPQKINQITTNSRDRALGIVAQAQAQIGKFSLAFKIVQRINWTGDRVRALRGITQAQAQFGKFAAAFETVRRIDQLIDRLNYRDEELLNYRAEALGNIAQEQAQTGEKAVARVTFDTALENAQRIDNAYLRTVALKTIAQAQVQAEEWKIARRTLTTAFTAAQKINDTKSRAKILGMIAQVQIQAGESRAARATFDFALNIAQRINNLWDRADVLKALAQMQAQRGEFITAFKVAQRIDWAEYRTEVIKGIAKMQAQTKEGGTARITFATAIRNTQKSSYTGDRAWGLKTVAQVQAQIGERISARTTIMKALDTVQKIYSPLLRMEILMAIAQAQAQWGERAMARETFDIAIKTAQRIDDDGVWGELAEAQAQVGEFTIALETTQRISSGIYRTEVIGSIAQEQIKVGERNSARATFAIAYKIAQKFEDEMHRVEALGKIAQAQAQVGERTAARMTFKVACEIAHGIDDEDERVMALRTIAQSQTQAGERAAARLTLDAILNNDQGLLYDTSLVMIVRGLAQVRDFTAALKISQRIKWADDRALALGIIAQFQTQVGDKDAARNTLTTAITTAHRINDKWIRSSVLRNIAEAQVQAGDFQTALVTVQGMCCPEDRAWILEEIAQSQAQVGEFSAALETIQRVNEAEKQAEMLGMVAQAQIQIGFGDQAIQTVKMILTDCNKRLPEIAENLVEVGDKEHFKQLLIPCATYLDSAYRMGGLLARLYPEQATAIADLLLQEEHLDKKHTVCDD